MNLITRGILVLAALLMAVTGLSGGVAATGTAVWHPASVLAMRPNIPPPDPCDPPVPDFC